MKISKNDIEALVAIYTTDETCKGNITRTTRKYCSLVKLEYDDGQRRKVSKLLQRHFKKQNKKAKSQVGTDYSPAKILIYDIETAPISSYVWGFWNQNNLVNMYKSDWFVLTWSAKWLFHDSVMSDKITPDEAIVEDDTRIVKSLWELFNEADIVVAHNALKFDNKKMNTRFLKHGMKPPMPYQTIDTLAHCRKKFSMSSNKLDYVAKFLGIEGKMDTGGFELWRGCLQGDQEYIDKMEKYNIQDIIVLEAVYLAIRPFINPHPNMGLFIEDNVQCCPACGSKDITFEGEYATYANTYDAFRCDSCNSIGRSRKSNIPTGSRKSLTMSTPK